MHNFHGPASIEFDVPWLAPARVEKKKHTLVGFNIRNDGGDSERARYAMHDPSLGTWV